VLLTISCVVAIVASSYGAGLTATSYSAQSTSSDAAFSYRFENPRFTISIIEVELASGGAGKLRFKRGEFDDLIDREFKVLPATLDRLRQLVAASGFMTSAEDYQSKKDFSHLGWMTITVKQAGRQRTVRFNYTTNNEISAVSDILRGISTQEIDQFDIELARQHEPLDVPRLLDGLENDLRLERMAEPERLLGFLGDLAGDDTLPLIARNQATRLIAGIRKGRFKSPVKAGRVQKDAVKSED
jgi:hypothetical protein